MSDLWGHDNKHGQCRSLQFVLVGPPENDEWGQGSEKPPDDMHAKM